MPVALSEPRAESMPRVFFSAFLAPVPLGFEGCDASSSLSRASFSAFLRAASSFLAAAASLLCCQRVSRNMARSG